MLRATLCRCGASKNKPFCDGAHAAPEKNFTATGEPQLQDTPPLADRGGKLVVKPLRNGPLVVMGNLEVCTGTGHTVTRVQKAALCRCGASRNKPFCDGTHAPDQLLDRVRAPRLDGQRPTPVVHGAGSGLTPPARASRPPAGRPVRATGRAHAAGSGFTSSSRSTRPSDGKRLRPDQHHQDRAGPAEHHRGDGAQPLGERAGLELAELVRAPTNIRFTALTRPRISGGVAAWVRVPRTTTLTMSAAPRSTSITTVSGSDRESPKITVHAPNTPTPASILGPARRPSGAERQVRRGDPRAQGRRAAHQPEPVRAHVEDVGGVHRQERGGAAQEDGDEIERDRPQQDLVPAHVVHARERGLERCRLPVDLSRACLDAGDEHAGDQQEAAAVRYTGPASPLMP